MSLPVVFRRAVGRDLAGAYWWYEERHRGLGEQFLAAVDATFNRIEQFPEIFAVRYGVCAWLSSHGSLTGFFIASILNAS